MSIADVERVAGRVSQKLYGATAILEEAGIIQEIAGRASSSSSRAFRECVRH